MFIYFSRCWPMFFWQEKKNRYQYSNGHVLSQKIPALCKIFFFRESPVFIYQIYRGDAPLNSFHSYSSFKKTLAISLFPQGQEHHQCVHFLNPNLGPPQPRSVTDVQLMCKLATRRMLPPPHSQTRCRGFSLSVNMGSLFIPQVQELST